MGPSGSRQRRQVEQFLESHPAILYWGDSWFSTPLYLNLARQSARRIEGLNMIIGKPGAQAAELFHKNDVERTVNRVRNNPFDVVCLSAGGNDCLSDRLAGVFRKWTGRSPQRTDKLDPAQAYQVFLDSKLLDGVLAAYDRVLASLEKVQARRKSLRVVGHPYVPIELIGQAADLTTANIGLIALLKNDVGPWLWGPMQFVLGSKKEGKAFARLMLEDGFRDSVLLRLQKKYQGFFSVVDYASVQGIGSKGFWNDEIHPTEHGFDLLASPFNAEIRRVLPASKRAAVGI
jgi:hypothetical protein